MNKVTEIVTAWSTAINPNQEQKRKAEIRYEICNSCEHKAVNDLTKLEYCGACGCPLSGKIFTPKTPEQLNCPKGKWPV